MKTTNNQIQTYFNAADKLAIKEVECLARTVLRRNPKKVKKFMMAMGSYFFIDVNDNIIHNCERNNEAYLQRLSGYNKLVSFINKWDEYFHLTGYPMTFTAEGKIITDW